MKERPILFNTEMVKAILDGRKTCTRRAIKFSNGMTGRPVGKAGDSSNPLGVMYPRGIKRPPYQPGDILYVRETWQKAGLVDEFDHVIAGTEKYYYAAGPEAPCFDFWVDPETGEHKAHMPWKPSIHMPKEAARIWLKVTDVRVERLQEITETQAQAEGRNSGLLTGPCTARGQFENLWNSTIKKPDADKYGWSANPWVWVIEFRRCEKPLECILKGYDKAQNDGPEKCLGYMYDDNSDTLIPMCEECPYQSSYESEE